jgi:hypothetical protein
MMVAMMMVMITVCCKSGAGAEYDHGEQQSLFHVFILATAQAVSGNFWVTPAHQDKPSVPRLRRTPKKKISVISR